VDAVAARPRAARRRPITAALGKHTLSTKMYMYNEQVHNFGDGGMHTGTYSSNDSQTFQLDTDVEDSFSPQMGTAQSDLSSPSGSD